DAPEGHVDSAAAFHRTASYPPVSTTHLLACPRAGVPRVRHHVGLRELVEPRALRSSFVGAVASHGAGFHRHRAGTFQYADTIRTDLPMKHYGWFFVVTVPGMFILRWFNWDGPQIVLLIVIALLVGWWASQMPVARFEAIRAQYRQADTDES